MSGYIGTQPVPQATQTRDSFTATSGQTSFATGGYTPNFLDVYLNGVKLASADYTASNGSDVVLASGAAAGDILDVVAFTTFTPADLPAGTPSIDDNGNATALTIDSSENLLIGKTATGGNVAGMQIINGSFFSHVRDGGVVQVLNRKSSDGDILSFEKDNTAVGSIGAKDGDLTIGTGDTGLYFSDGANSVYPYNTSTQADRDASVDLGYPTVRFKDLYLSGGVYLGGTGSANLLDSYEEGTFTAGVSEGTIGGGDGVYVKVGNMVYVGVTIGNFSNTSSGNAIRVTGLPFTSHSTGHGSNGSVFCRYISGGFPDATQVDSGATTARMWKSGSTAWASVNHNDITNGGNAYFFISLTYRAA